MVKVILERKGTGEKKVYSCDNRYNASQIYTFLQENDNKNNDYLVYLED